MIFFHNLFYFTSIINTSYTCRQHWYYPCVIYCYMITFYNITMYFIMHHSVSYVIMYNSEGSIEQVAGANKWFMIWCYGLSQMINNVHECIVMYYTSCILRGMGLWIDVAVNWVNIQFVTLSRCYKHIPYSSLTHFLPLKHCLEFIF